MCRSSNREIGQIGRELAVDPVAEGGGTDAEYNLVDSIEPRR